MAAPPPIRCQQIALREPGTVSRGEVRQRFKPRLCARTDRQVVSRLRSVVLLAPALVTILLLGASRRATAQDAVVVLSPGPVLSTVAGTGQPGGSGNGTAATQARLSSPSGLAYDAAGNLLFADTRNQRIRRVSPTGVITTVAGSGVQGFAGDGGVATAAQLDTPLGVAVAADGTIFLADSRNQRVRRIALDGTITTVAGNGAAGFGGDTGSATSGQLRNPSAVAVGLLGELYIADTGNHRVRRIALDGTITTVAGNGREENTGDGGPAVLAGLDAPSALTLRATDGALLIADRLNSRIRVVTSDGRIASLPVGAASLRRASGVGADPGGNIYIADSGNFRLRAITSNGSGVLLGSGEQGTPDALAAYNSTPLGRPYGIVPDVAGGVSFTDLDHSQVQHFALPHLDFATTVAGQVSLPQTLLIRNTSGTVLTVAAVTITGAFSIGHAGSCSAAPFILLGEGSCSLALAFSPSTVGAQSGSISIETGGLPQRALLQGTAVAAGVLLQTSTVLNGSGTLSYVGVPVPLRAQVLASGTAAPTGTIHLLDAATEVAQGQIDGTGAVAFTVTPTIGQHALSARYDGDAHYASSVSAEQTQTVVLAPDFALTTAAASLSTAAGASGQIAVLLQPLNGTLNQQVTLRVDGLPSGATVRNDAPTPLVLASNAVTVTFALTVPATVAAVYGPAPTVSLALLSIPFLCSRRHLRGLAVVLAGFVLLLLLAGCGGGYLSGADPATRKSTQSYPITITATTTGVTGSTLVHTTTFTLVVQ